MSLATRCPACSTVFRVVQDQLKVSGGWVRCGQCHQVFNGLQTLFELPPEPLAAQPPPHPAQPSAGLFVRRTAPQPAPQPAPLPEPEPGPSWVPTEPAPLDGPAEPMTSVDLADDEPDEMALINPEASAPAPAPLPWAYRPQVASDDTSEAETVVPPEDEAEEADPAFMDAFLAGVHETAAQPSDSWVAEPTPGQPQTWPLANPSAVEAASAAQTASATEEPQEARADTPTPMPEPPAEAQAAGHGRRSGKRQRKPAFMRQAERAARWRSPAVRALLGGTSAILGLMLALQIVHQQRDDLAAQWPAMREPLAAWCSLANCQLQPPRALTSLTLDSSALSRTARPQVLRFEAELHNSASHVVQAPALEVSFTDTLGHQLARKVLLPEQMHAPVAGLPPDRAWHVEVPLQVGELQIAGFTAEVFYP